MDAATNRIYSATYSNVPVYEFNVNGEHVMRRRSDQWINATHILKVAGYDKPARTRILEREVQKGVHEKVQGGYGKYQGTWISLEDGRVLAERTGCLDKLLPMFDFQPGDRSPPPAPKHMTAQTNRPKAQRAMAPPRKVPVAARSRVNEVSYDTYKNQLHDEEGTDPITMSSESEATFVGNVNWPTKPRKRKRGMEQPPETPQLSQEDQQHLMWSDELLDYFMLQRSDDSPPTPPDPPEGINLNRPVDEKGNTALHWASAMGDMYLVQSFVARGADIDVLTNQGATPLIHAVTFTNNFDKQTMHKLMEILYPSVGQRDCCASTVFHHIAASTMSKSKYQIARYYLGEILKKLKQVYEAHDIATLLDLQDENGSTATLLAAKNGARKCVRLMTSLGARIDIANVNGEVAEQYIVRLNERRRDRERQVSSSPAIPSDGFCQTDDVAAKFPNQPLLQGKSLKYTSDAATNLASQLPVLIQSRAEALAAALESELIDREGEAREGERLLDKRRQELSTVQKQILSISSGQDEVEMNDQKLDELESYENETRRLLNDEGQIELGGLVRTHKSAMAQDQSQDHSPASWRLAQHAKLARELSQAQQRNVDLMESIVQAQGVAGVDDEKHAAYKRLVTIIVGTSPDGIENVLPEILEELEDAKHDRGDAKGVTTIRLDDVHSHDEPATAHIRMAASATSNVMQGNGSLVYAPVQVAG